MLNRCQSADSIALSQNSEENNFRIRTISYLSFPRSYRQVAEDIWHWAPEPAVSSDSSNGQERRNSRLYLETLTYQVQYRLAVLVVLNFRTRTIVLFSTVLLITPWIRL